MSFGTDLRRERERRNLSIEDLARTIVVAPSVLEALENDDLASLPGGPFNKGFVRAYARSLGLDAEATVAAYARAEKASGLRTPDADRDLDHHHHRMIEWRDEDDRRKLVLDWRAARLALLGAAAAGFAVAGIWLVQGLSSPPTPARAAGPDVMAAVAGTPAGVAAVLPAAPDAGLTPAASAGAPLPPDASAPEMGDDRIAPDSSPAEPSPATVEEIVADRSGATLAVAEAGVGAAVIDHRLVGPRSRFTRGEKAWFWTRTLGGASGDQLRHVWLRDGRVVATYDLSIGGPHWRNASRRTLTEPGRWTVEARDLTGRVLARRRLICAAPKTMAAGN
ncbi:MAG: DUF2914 domain-containing protein [Acidobacteriota bacterium]